MAKKQDHKNKKDHKDEMPDTEEVAALNADVVPAPELAPATPPTDGNDFTESSSLSGSSSFDSSSSDFALYNDNENDIGDLVSGAFNHIQNIQSSFGFDADKSFTNSEFIATITDTDSPFANSGFGNSDEKEEIHSFAESARKAQVPKFEASQTLADDEHDDDHDDEHDDDHDDEHDDDHDDEHDDDDDHDDETGSATASISDDYIRGGHDDDTLDGGAGNDVLDGDRGDDTLIYDLGENEGFTNFYDGGKGSDKLVLKMSADKFEELKDEISQLESWMNDNANDKRSAGHGFKDSSDHSANHPVFETSFGLNVRNIEELEVEITTAAPVDVNIDLSDPLQSPAASPSAIITTTTGNGAISISSADVQLSAGSTITLSVDVNVQNITPMYDVFLINDLSWSMYGDHSWYSAINAAKTGFSSLYDSLTAGGDVNMAVGSFSDKPIQPYGFEGDYNYSGPQGRFITTDFPYNTDIGMTADKNALQTTFDNLEYYYGGDAKDSQLEVLLQTALRSSTEIGFRDGAMKFAVLSTDSAYHQAGDFNTTANNYDTVFDIEDYPDPAIVGQMLLDAGIIPVFAVTTDQIATYQALVDSWGFGTVTAWSADSAGVISAIDTYVANNTTDLSASIVGDDFGLVSSISPTSYANISAGTYTFDVTFDIPLGSTSYGSDALVLEIPGYGTVDINIDVPRVDATGDTGNDVLLGDNGANGLFGLAGMDTINGAGGNDLIVGGIGNDMLSGGAGDDTFVFVAGDGNDVITDFNAGGVEDALDITGLNAFVGFADVMASASQVGADVIIDFGAGDSVTLNGAMLADLTVDDFLI